MKKKYSTKKALIASALMLCMCFSMLVGTTFAWFTDSVTSGSNVIKTGNLDIEVEYTLDGENWADLAGATDLFQKGLWEPGHTELVALKVQNTGTLALKYNANMLIMDEVFGLNKNGEDIVLSDILTVSALNMDADPIGDVLMSYTFTSEDAMPAESWDNHAAFKDAKVLGEDQVLLAGTSKYVLIKVDMAEDVGNEANHDGVNVPYIDFGINVLATQLTYENDSFGNDYDKDALFCDVLATPATIDEVLATVEEGTIIGLAYGNYDVIVLPKNDLTLVTKSAVVAGVNLNGTLNATIDGLTFDVSKGTTLWNYASGGKVTDSGITASIVDTTEERANYGAQNVTVKNCMFVGTPADVDHFSCIATTNYRSSLANKNYTVENCVFACNALQYLKLDYVNGDIVVKNNAFGGNGFGTKHHNINATGSNANWTITGNSFNNWAEGEYAFGSSKQGSEHVNITIQDNTFAKTLAAGAQTAVLSIKTSYTAANSTVVISDNEYNAGAATITATPDASGKYYMVGSDTVTVVNTPEDAQNAFDAATSGATIQLMPGVDYGTLEIIAQVVSENKKPVANSGNTEAVDYFTSKYPTGEFVRKLDNVTIVGVPGAKVDAIKFISGTFKVDIPETGKQSGTMYRWVEINNLVIDGVEFTDKSTIGANAGFVSPIFMDLQSVKVNGLTVKNCKLEGNKSNMNFVYAYGNAAKDCTFGVTLNDVVIANNTVSGIARLCELREANNVTITGNNVENTTREMALLANNTGEVYSGDIICTENVVDDIASDYAAQGREGLFFRVGAGGDANIVVKDNVITNSGCVESSFVGVTGHTGTLTVENNTLG